MFKGEFLPLIYIKMGQNLPDIPNEINFKHIVSACLVGYNCRYDGKNSETPHLRAMTFSGTLLPICPEMWAGLSSPRQKIMKKSNSCRGGVSFIYEDGRDATGDLNLGVSALIYYLRNMNIGSAILKEKSPSCGVKLGGTDNGTAPGAGIFTTALNKLGFKVKGVF